MREVLFYFLQVIIISGILYGYYHLFLRNNKFHRYNRFYLLGATLVSLLLPFFDFTFYFRSEEDIPAVYQVLSTVRVSNNMNHSFLSTITRNLILNVLYIFITLFFLTRFCISLYKLKKLHSKYHSEKMNNISFVNTNEEGTPFSFFNWLFWNEKIPIDSPNGQKILNHELFHIQQKHSWDIIYIELLTITCWLNPFFYLIKREIKVIHEFLADQYASDQQNKGEYAELLLMQVLKTDQKLINPFFHNQIKRRIAMITSSTKPGFTFLKKILVLPILAIIISMIAINCTSKDVIEKEETTKIDIATIPDTNVKEIDTIPNTNPNVTEQKSIKQNDQALLEPSFPGGSAKWRKYLEKNLNANIPVDNGAPEGLYTVEVQFDVDADGIISDVKALTKHGFGMEEEVIELIKKGPKWIPAEQNGKKVKAIKKQPITFVVTTDY